MRRVRALVSIAVVATVAGVIVSLAGAGPVASGTTIATFSDSVGEQAGAPDISTVTVSLDGGVLTVEATVAGMPELMSPGSLMFLLNTDSNTATGEYRGADYVLFANLGTLESTVLRWNGSDYVSAEKVAEPSRILIGTSAGFMINLANLGSPKHIEFLMTVLKGPTEGGLLDVAPDSGLWAFDVVVPTPAPTPTPTPTPAPAAVKPVIGAPARAPAAVVAGKRLTVTFPVTRSDNGRALTSGRMICDPSVTGKVIPHAESFRAGKARLSFLVPKTAKGKLLKVTITSGSQLATKIATFRVR